MAWAVICWACGEERGPGQSRPGLPTGLSPPRPPGGPARLTRSSACWLMKVCCWAASCLASTLGSRAGGCGGGGTTMAAGYQVAGQVSTRATGGGEALCPLCPLGLGQDPPSSRPSLRRDPALPGMAGTVPTAGIMGMGAGIIAGWYPGICTIPGYTEGTGRPGWTLAGSLGHLPPAPRKEFRPTVLAEL